MDNRAATSPAAASGIPHASDLWRLAAIGVVAGAFSGLFGVGGGAVIVPLLVIWFGFSEKLATGTSLLAIAVIAAFAAASHGIFGTVDVVKGLLVGIPAIAGVIGGTALQQRLPDRLLAAMFSALLLAVAIIYVVE